MWLALLIALPLATAALAEPEQPDMTDLIRAFESRNGTRRIPLDADSSHSYDMLSLFIDYWVEPDTVPAVGTVSITLTGVEEADEIPFNAEELIINGVNEFDWAVPFHHVNDTLYVERHVSVGETLTLDISVEAPPRGDWMDDGYNVDQYHVFTSAEPYGSRRWYPCFDQPFDKFNEVTIAINMPEHWFLASNGVSIETTYPEPGRKREVYYHDYPISSYLVMICAGEYTRCFETVNEVEFRYFAWRQDSADAAFDWEQTPEMTALFSEYFGDYPFEQYGMVEAAIFGGWGAMEHQTFTTFGHRLIDGVRTYEGIVAHELAHQWFGDALSPVDFRNMWLNEGFATYSDALWSEYAEGDVAFREKMTSQANAYFSEDDIFRYAAYDPPEDYLFGRVIYQKSSWVLHMLRSQLLGDSLFFAALQDYFAAHIYGLVDTEDLITVINETAGEDLHWFFDQWIYQAGHPEIEYEIHAGVPQSNSVTVDMIQRQQNAPVFRFPLEVTAQTTEGPVTRLFWFDSAEQSVTENYLSDVTSAELTEFQPVLYELYGQGTPDNPPVEPRTFRLNSPYPNPFNAAATISFDVDSERRVTLSLYNVNGRLVQTLADNVYPAGRHQVVFSADRELASGLYFITMVSGSRKSVQKIVLLK